MNINYNYLNEYFNDEWLKMIIKNKDKVHWECISSHDFVTIETIKKYPNLPWCYRGISHNKNINMKYVLENLDKDWNFSNLSHNKSITIQDIRDNPQFNWNYGEVVRRISMDELNQNLDLLGDYLINLDENPNTPITYFEENKLEWEWRQISINNTLNWDIIKKYKNRWEWEWISSNPVIDWKIVKNNNEYPWNWVGLSYNENFDWNFIKQKISEGYKFSPESFSCNPNLTPFIVNKEKNVNWVWTVFGIDENPMNLGKEKWIKDKITKSSIIITNFFRNIYNRKIIYIIREHCICPISLSVMKEPVIDNEGVSYEKSYIEEWLNKGNNTSPITNKRLELKDLKPNYTLKKILSYL